MDGKFIGIDELSIDYYGVGLIIKLVELRVKKDIKLVEERLELELKESMNTNNEGFLAAIKNGYGNNKVKQTRKEVDDKKAWLQDWQEKTWTTIPKEMKIREKSLDELISLYRAKPVLRLKMFLLLQEAVLLPIYTHDGKKREVLKEIDMDGSLKAISQICDFHESMGKVIYKKTGSFLKKSSEYWKRMIKWSFIATGLALITAGMAAPTIATTVGGMLGLSGAAVTTAGFAVFGGGAIAAGGMGMAGGMQVLVGGGALIGALSGAGLANLIGKLPQEAVAVSMAKTINYVEYLQNDNDYPLVKENNNNYINKANIKLYKEEGNANEISRKILNHFLTSKYNVEVALMLNPDLENREEALKNIKIMNLAYHELLEKVSL